LVRKIVFEAAGFQVTDLIPELGRTVGEELLTPTRLYVRPIRELAKIFEEPEGTKTGETSDPLARPLHGLANITGGGLPDNVARILPPGKRVFVNRDSWPVPPVFRWLQKLGNVADAEMFRVFNMGIGFVVICAPSSANRVLESLASHQIPAWTIGAVRAGEVGVQMD
jgi:phosphoribosylformylglycinamidine cyclo-ligase